MLDQDLLIPSDGGLADNLQVVVLLNEVIKIISSLFIFFYEKISRAQKHVTSKNQLTKQKQANTKQQRQQFFTRA